MKTRRLERGDLPALVVLALVVAGAVAPAARSSDRNPDMADGFRAMMNDATARMHVAMNVPFTGDADRDFARMMIPHHQGAIDMARTSATAFVLAALAVGPARAGQVPGPAAAPDVPVSARDRVYAAEQFSNTVSVIDPAANKLLGVIRLGEPQPANLSPLYRGQVLVHGLGFSPDHRTLAVVSIGSNSVTFID